MHCIKEEVKLMEKGGSIVNAASLAGIKALPGSGAVSAVVPHATVTSTCSLTFMQYGVSKHGVVGLTRVVATDYGPKGIRCNAVAPGCIDTPMFRVVNEGKGEQLAKRIAALPIARKAEAEEVGEVVLFLLSDAASYITGQTISVDGGWNV